METEFDRLKESIVSKSERLVYLNSHMVPESDAKISIFDIGRLYGATLYESIRTFNHKLFKLEDHIRRLASFGTYALAEHLAAVGD